MALRAVKDSNLKFVRHGDHFLVFQNDRLIRTMPIFSGGADRTVRVRLEAVVAGYQAKMAAASASTKAFGANVLSVAQKNAAAFTTVGLGAVALGGGIALGFKAANDAAIDFESSFAGVRKTVDATEAEFAALSDGLRQMATEIPVNVNELNNIAEAAGQLGIAKEGILEFTRTVAMLGITTTLSTEEAANGLARVANIMGTSEGDFGRLGSSIVALGNAGASTESEILNFGLRLAGAGKIAGLSEAQVLAIGSAMSSVGIEAEAGGTAVQKVLLSITDAVNTGGKTLRQFADTAGMSAEQFAADWRADPAEAFVAFVEGLGASGQDAMSVLKKLGLSDQRLIRSFLSLAGAGELLNEQLDLGTESWSENTANQEEFAKRLNTTESQVALAKNEINDLAISIGNLTKGLYEGALTGLGEFAGTVNELPGPVKALVSAMTALVGVFALVGGGMLLVLPRIAATKLALAELGAFGAGVARMFGGIGAAISAVPWSALAFGRGAFDVEGPSQAELDERFGRGAGAALEAGSIATAEDNLAAARGRAADAARLGAQGAFELAKAESLVASAGTAAAAAETAAAKAAADAVTPMAAFKTAMKEATSQADELAAALDYLTGGTIDTEKASLSWLNTLESLRGTIKDNGNTLDRNTEKGRANRESILGSVDAAFAHAQAVAEETGSVKRGTKVFGDHISQLLGVAEASGISRAAVKRYLDQLNLTPKDVRTMLKLLGVDKAKSDLAGIKAGLDSIPSTKTVSVLIRQLGDPGGATPVKHAGGYAGSAGAARYGSLRSDEVPSILQKGELVLSRGQVASFASLVQGAQRGGTDGAAASPAPFIGSIDVDGERMTKTVTLHQGKNKILLGGRPR